MATIIILAFRLYELLIVIRVVTSWIQVDRNHPLMDWLYRLTEPVLEPVRRIFGGDRIGIDFSPLVVLLLLQLLEQVILRVAF
jgi:YggT family protein